MSATPAHVPLRLERDMGCTLAEFERWLPGATRDAPRTTRHEGDSIVHSLRVGPGTVEIHLLPRPPRRIASVTLPVLAVTFVFAGLDDGARWEFLEWFDRYTRRGGG